MIQWYPGHMARATRLLKKDLKLIDLVVELLDARIPKSSQNPELDKLLHNQEKVIALNKSDLASQEMNKKWLNHFKEKSLPAVLLNSLIGEGIQSLVKIIEKNAREINKRVVGKGRKERDIRIMIIGIPNVGKSALINTLAGNNIAKTGNKPGVTRGRQWIKVGKRIQLLDTPGILWPKFENEDIAYKLALTGAVKDDLFDMELAAYKLIELIQDIDSNILSEVYGLDMTLEDPYELLAEIGRKRGCIMSGGKIDRPRASKLLVNDFRQGKLGRITLERP